MLAKMCETSSGLKRIGQFSILAMVEPMASRMELTALRASDSDSTRVCESGRPASDTAGLNETFRRISEISSFST